MVRAVAAYVAPSAASIALRAVTFTLTFGHLVSFSSIGYICWPEVAVRAPPIAVLVVVAFYVTVRVLLFTSSVDAPDLLVDVTGIRIETFTASPVFALAVQLLVSVVR